TGVGRGVEESIVNAYREDRLPAGYPPIGITITGGQEVNGWNVPKFHLVSRVLALLEERRLEISAELPLRDKLVQELTDFRVKISAAGRDTFEARTEGAHDDLVSALCLALWIRHERSEASRIDPTGREWPR
ncbi:MAG: hypothetical protein ACREOS_04150, partial [Candidatus Dormibacteraceae bacterium]